MPHNSSLHNSSSPVEEVTYDQKTRHRRSVGDCFFTGSIIAIVSQLIIISSTVSRAATSESLAFLLQTATTYVGEFQSFFNRRFKICLGSKATLEALLMIAGEDNQPPDRRLALASLKTVLLENPDDTVGVWTGWEPNAFDGRDSEFIGREGHDQTGRL